MAGINPTASADVGAQEKVKQASSKVSNWVKENPRTIAVGAAALAAIAAITLLALGSASVISWPVAAAVGGSLGAAAFITGSVVAGKKIWEKQKINYLAKNLNNAIAGYEKAKASGNHLERSNSLVQLVKATKEYKEYLATVSTSRKDLESKAQLAAKGQTRPVSIDAKELNQYIEDSSRPVNFATLDSDTGVSMQAWVQDVVSAPMLAKTDDTFDAAIKQAAQQLAQNITKNEDFDASDISRDAYDVNQALPAFAREPLESVETELWIAARNQIGATDAQIAGKVAKFDQLYANNAAAKQALANIIFDTKMAVQGKIDARLDAIESERDKTIQLANFIEQQANKANGRLNVNAADPRATKLWEAAQKLAQETNEDAGKAIQRLANKLRALNSEKAELVAKRETLDNDPVSEILARHTRRANVLVHLHNAGKEQDAQLEIRKYEVDIAAMKVLVDQVPAQRAARAQQARASKARASKARAADAARTSRGRKGAVAGGVLGAGVGAGAAYAGARFGGTWGARLAGLPGLVGGAVVGAGAGILSGRAFGRKRS